MFDIKLLICFIFTYFSQDNNTILKLNGIQVPKRGQKRTKHFKKYEEQKMAQTLEKIQVSGSFLNSIKGGLKLYLGN